MERSIFAALIGAFWEKSLRSVFGFLWGPFEPPQTTSAPICSEGDWRLSTRHLRKYVIFPVVSSNSQDTSPFLTLEEGLSTASTRPRAGLRSHSSRRDGRSVPVPQYNAGASVNQLVLINRSRRPLLLLAGELVSAANRTASSAKTDHSPGAPPLPLSVFCVEHAAGPASRNSPPENHRHPSVREEPPWTRSSRGLGRGTQAAPPPKRLPPPPLLA